MSSKSCRWRSKQCDMGLARIYDATAAGSPELTVLAVMPATGPRPALRGRIMRQRVEALSAASTSLGQDDVCGVEKGKG
jgi:hypothetical protein